MSAIVLYRLLQILGLPFLVVYFLLRGLKDRRYFRKFGERLGFLPDSYRQTGEGAIWLHAVSVGEALSAAGLLRRLRAEFPRAPLYVSATTLAGRAAAEDKLRGLADGVFYAPIDYCAAVRRVLRKLRPRAVVVLETEIWPNLYREAKRAGCALVVVNGRISDRAAPRYRRLAWFFRQVLAWPDAILAQSEISGRRYLELGASAEKVRVAGNLKYDFEPGQAQIPEAVRELMDRIDPKEVWIASSTMPPARDGDPDEDEVVVEAFEKLGRPGLLLILAPRKPERFDTAAELLRRKGAAFLRRSELRSGTPLALPGVLLLDSIGELSSLFALADVVFMGGTLAQRGGHNILEPALFRRAIVVGPHMENFPEIARRFAEGGGVYPIASGAELGGAVARLLEDVELRARLGQRAGALAEGERGATARAAEEIGRQYWQAVPAFRPPAPLSAVLWPLSRLWLLGGRWKRACARPVRLATPVISVGGITVGGTGKTPFVLWLAQRLKADGIQPAILMRGYRRRAPEKVTILGPGGQATPARTGDEAQSYLRSSVGPVGIGANRVAAARRIEEQYQPGVFLLDDGFQHFRLERSLDIVLIDALDPFGGGQPIPLGRLREGVEALRRADIVVITRVEANQRLDGIEAVIRRHNPEAPIFRSRVVAEGWRPRVVQGPVGAFCGLGNPEAFWRTLEGLGIRPVWRRAFRDHHRYTAEELREMTQEACRRGAEALVTTEKDLMNLPEGWGDMTPPLEVLWLQIRMQVEAAEELLARVRAGLSG
ncbi:MAG: tetraacyldisaccharide 4'-kinase [Bryobacteraceae bacterium]